MVNNNKPEDHGDIILYRAVSSEELEDIKINGLENKPGAFETVKLFACNYDDACAYGEINKHFDKLDYTIIKVSVSRILYLESFKFLADGMDAVAIEEEHLKLLKVI